MAVPLRGLLQLLAAENIPILILIVVGVLALRCIDADDKPAATERGLTIMVLVGLPSQMREGVDQGGRQNQPLVVEGVKGVKAVAHLTDVTQLFQRDVVIFAELFQFHVFSPFNLLENVLYSPGIGGVEYATYKRRI